MGTLSEKWIESMQRAAKKAKESRTPFVFDPVGVGASNYRTDAACRIIQAGTPDVIRGNASGIMAPAKVAMTTKGVDSTADPEDAVQSAQKLSKKLNNSVVVSVKEDNVVTQA